MRYFVTTGTSLRTSSRCWLSKKEAEEGRPRNSDLLGGEIDEAVLDEIDTRDPIKLLQSENHLIYLNQTRRAGEVCEALPPRAQGRALEDYVQNDARQLVGERFDRSCWDLNKRRLLPAELATILTMCHVKPADREPHFMPNDSLILLCGRSNEREAALLTAMLRELAADGCSAFPLQEDYICLMQVEPGWDPTKPKSFHEGMNWLWKRVNEHFPGSINDDEAQFIITAGYKGVIADLCIRIGKFAKTTRLFYLHDEAEVGSVDHGLVCLKIKAGHVGNVGC